MRSTRRMILKGATALASLFVARSAAGQAAGSPAPPGSRTPAPSPSTTPSPAPSEPGPLARAARERFGKYLNAEELKMLDVEMASIERRSTRLAALPLANGEEPATDFRVNRS
jgi:hypothetical protein